MKKKILQIKIVLTVCIALNTLCGSGQDITGQWNGILKVQTTQLRVVFNISKTEDGYSSTLDSPDQGAMGIPLAITTFEKSELTLKDAGLGIEYVGEFSGDSITGNFMQSGLTITLVLKREMVEKASP